MKYFWYYLRTSYRDGQIAMGYHDSSQGWSPSSKNLDYMLGYEDAVEHVQAQAEELAITVEQLRRAEAKIETLQAAANKVEQQRRSNR